jgi:PIN domain nuclease of toxin-antitoxin system
VRLLLDTHALLWFLWDDRRLPRHVADLIEDPANLKLVSIASAWEIAIKWSLGKLTLQQPLDAFLRDQVWNGGFNILRVELPHLLAVSSLPLHHRDPFDRMLIAQSQVEGAHLLSAETLFDRYGVQRVW